MAGALEQFRESLVHNFGDISNLPGSQQILSSGSHYCADWGNERLLLRRPLWLFLYNLHTITTTILNFLD